MIKKGFTLIELLIVISIIAILSTLVYVNWANAQLRARDNKRKADLQAISSALTLYYADNKYYILRPLTGGVDQPSVIGSRGGYSASDLDALKNFNYISDIPKDPLNKISQSCNYLYLQNNSVSLKPQQYKLISISAESLGEESNQCKSSAGGFANSQKSCKILQTSSSVESKQWKYSNAVKEADVVGCANYPKIK